MNLFRQSELNSARLMTSNVKTRQILHGQKLGSSLIELVNIYHIEQKKAKLIC
jgi:hypothetical protein